VPVTENNQEISGMSAVRARIDRLERQMGDQGKGKIVVLKAGPSNDDVDAALADIGIDADDPRNQVIILRTLFEDRSGGLAACQPKAEVLYTMDRR
jgi:hypothetical protein